MPRPYAKGWSHPAGARRSSASPGGRVSIRDMTNRSNWSPIEVGAVLSTSSIACTCSGCISGARFDAMRATPALLALGPAFHPIGESRIAIVLCSRNFCILPTTLSMLNATPLLLLGRPLRGPISLPISAIERIYRTSDRRRRCLLLAWAMLDVALRTTTHGRIHRQQLGCSLAFVRCGPEEVTEQAQGQQQASECRKDE